MSINDVSPMLTLAIIAISFFMITYPHVYISLFKRIKNNIVYLIFVYCILATQLYSLNKLVNNIIVTTFLVATIVLVVMLIFSLKNQFLKTLLAKKQHCILVHVLLVEIVLAIILAYYIALLL